MDFNDPLTDAKPVSDGPDGPSTPNGTRNGANTGPGCSVEPPAGDGEPNAATDLRYCRKCEMAVVPVGKGKCGQCGSFLSLNFVARKHRVNVLRREALLAELVAQFRPVDILARSACEHLSAVLEQLDSMRPGTTEWQRLVTTAQTLGTALRSAQPEARTPADYSAHSKDELIAKLETLLNAAREARDYERSAPLGDSADGGVYIDVPEPGDAADSVPSAPPVETPPAPEVPEVPEHIRRVIDYNTPAEVERRRREATAVMMTQVGKPPSPFL